MAVATALLRRFEDLSKEDVDYAGGKGANLGEMTAAGLPVPPGFVVGASSYALFCDTGGLRDRIEEQLSAVDVDDTAALDSRHQGGPQDGRGGARPRRGRQRDPHRLPRARGRPRQPACGRPLLRDRGGHRGRLLRRHERDLPQCPRPRRGRRRRPPLLVLAVRRPDRLLSRQAGLRPGRYGHRRRRPDPNPLHSRGRHVHHRPGLRRPGSPRDRGLPRARRVGRLGPGLPRPLRGREGVPPHRQARREAQGAGDRAAPGRGHPHSRALRRRVDEACAE